MEERRSKASFRRTPVDPQSLAVQAEVVGLLRLHAIPPSPKSGQHDSSPCDPGGISDSTSSCVWCQATNLGKGILLRDCSGEAQDARPFPNRCTASNVAMAITTVTVPVVAVRKAAQLGP